MITFTNDIGHALTDAVSRLRPDRVAVVTDDVVRDVVLPSIPVDGFHVISFPAGEGSKNISTATRLWEECLRFARLTRHSLIVNIGGGVVCDMGGFVASTFKRGMRTVNIPTTLLAAVDASVGGKTGVNLDGVKNIIGTFHNPTEVIVSSRFFASLPERELLSGYGEMLKHALLDSHLAVAEVLTLDMAMLCTDAMLPLLERNIAVKQQFVEADPFERGPRKALNLGHTAGHAYEALAMEKGRVIPHGHAVAMGLVTALALSRMRGVLGSPDILYQLASRVRELYGGLPVGCDDYPRLLELMHADKKNRDTHAVMFTLLRSPGDPAVDCPATDDDISAAIDITRDLLT